MFRSIRVPSEIYMPFPTEVSKDYEKLVEVINAWAARVGLIKSKKAVERFIKSDFSFMTAANFPKVPLPRLILITKFIILLFMVYTNSLFIDLN